MKETSYVYYFIPKDYAITFRLLFSASGFSFDVDLISVYKSYSRIDFSLRGDNFLSGLDL